MAMEDDGDRKILDLKKKYKRFYQKNGVYKNDKKIDSQFKKHSFVLYAAFIGTLFLDNEDYFLGDATSLSKPHLFLWIITISTHIVFNIIICFASVGSLNFVEFEQKHPVKSLTGRWLFTIPTILLFFLFIYDMTILSMIFDMLN